MRDLKYVDFYGAIRLCREQARTKRVQAAMQKARRRACSSQLEEIEEDSPCARPQGKMDQCHNKSHKNDIAMRAHFAKSIKKYSADGVGATGVVSHRYF